MTCRNCTKRKAGCHSTCEDYLKEKAERERIKEKKDAENEMRDYGFDRDKTFRKDRYQSAVFRSRKR